MMRHLFADAESRRLFYLWAFISLYITAVQASHHVVSPTADLDHAEQLILSQSVARGYGAQPPLYTYLVAIAFALFGPSYAALLVIKAALLSMLVGALIRVGVRLGFTFRQQMISMSGLAFLPQLLWESQRDLTHSVLATTIAALTLLTLLKMYERRTSMDYLLLGALVAAGLLSKYNYALTLVSFIASGAFLPGFRRILLHRRFVITLLAVLGLTAPHGLWVAEHLDLALSAAEKLEAGRGSAVSGAADAAIAAVAFLSPLWIFAPALCARIRGADIRSSIEQPEQSRFVFGLLPSAAAVVALFVLASNAQEMRERWYLPLLFYSPLLIAALATSADRKRSAIYIGLGTAFAIAAAVLMPARVVWAAYANTHVRQNIPYARALALIRDAVGHPEFVLSDTKMLGGHARLVFPASRVIAARVNARSTTVVAGRGIVICESPDCDDSDLREWLLSRYDVDLSSLTFHSVEAPYYYFPSKTLKIHWAAMHLPR